MNVTALHALVRLQLRDDSKEFVPDSDLIIWYNVAQRELADRLGLIEGKVTAGVTAGSKFALPAEFLAPLSLEVGGQRYEFVDDDEFQSTLDGDLGYPYGVARIFNGYVELAPAVVDGTTYDFEYEKGPTDLAVGADISALPSELHNRLAWYATAHALLKEREEALADRFMQMFGADLPPAGLGTGRTRPGPFRLRREPSSWDIIGTHVGVGGQD